MAQGTKVTPDMIRGSADRHDSTSANFKRQEDQVTGQVEFLYNANSGELMKKLKSIQETWTSEIEDMQKRLNTLAEYMRECAGKLEERNRQHADDLK